MPRLRPIATLALIATAGVIAVSTFAGTAEFDPETEAQHLRREAELLLREADRLEMEAHEIERRELVGRLDEVRELEKMMRQVDELHAQGRVAEAEHLALQIDERIINNERAARASEHSPRRESDSWWGTTTTATTPRPRPAEDRRHELEMQIHHMEIAAEHLEAAGMHDSADQLWAHIESVIGDWRVHEPRRGRVDRELATQIAELSGQLQELRGHVIGLTEVVEKMQDDLAAAE